MQVLSVPLRALLLCFHFLFGERSGVTFKWSLTPFLPIRLFMTMFCLVGCSHSYAKDRSIDYPAAGVKLGVGWNSAWSSPADDVCIEYVLATEPAQIGNTTIKDFRSVETLRSRTNTSVEFTAKAIAGISGSIKASFLDELNTIVDEQSYAVHGRVDNESETAGPASDGPLRLKDKYVTLLGTANGLIQFQRICGDSFVSRRYGGAELLAVTTLRSVTRESQDNVTLSFDASGIIASLKGNMATEEGRRKVEESLNFKVLLIGGSGATGAFDKASINELIKNLPKFAKEAPKYWQMDVRRYDDLWNWPAIKLDSPTERRLQLATIQYVRLNEIARLTSNALSNEHGYIRLSLLKSALQGIDEKIYPILRKLKYNIGDCLKNEECDDLPSDDDFDYYKAYSFMPLRRGATDFDKNLLELESTLAAQYTAIALLQDKIFAKLHLAINCEQILQPPPPPPNSSGAIVPPGPVPDEIVQLKTTCESADSVFKKISSLKLLEEQAVKSSLVQIWVRDIRDESCASDPSHNLCLSQKGLTKIEGEIGARNLPMLVGVELDCESLALRIKNLTVMETQVPNRPESEKAVFQKQREELNAEAVALAQRSGMKCVDKSPAIKLGF